MNSQFSDLINQLNEIDHLYHENPPKALFILVLMLSDAPLSDQELDSLILNIENYFHHHGERPKVQHLINKIRTLRAAARDHPKFHDIISLKITNLIQTPSVLEYLKKHRQVNHSNQL